jgi:hypothetical protein
MEEKKFITKTGVCEVFPDKIVIRRVGAMGGLAKVMVGNGIYRILNNLWRTFMFGYL